MATATEVLTMLIPNGGWATTGQTYEDIQFLECKPITKKEFEDGFAQYDAWKTQQDATKATTKAALLVKLGITQAEADLLLA